ncbi:MAG: hypothetical protein VKJ46_10610 [Leptolyngbyaceae bacterium]|nr:hypothetical protein [Leptolyngbyaceae bacterium]
MNVLIIPEDFRKDQYFLKPIIKAMLDKLGKPTARVQVCVNPRLQGVSEALKWDNIAAIIDQYGMVDLFLLCIDRDGNGDRKAKLTNLEQRAAEVLGKGDRKFLAENAWQEIEVWVLAGHELPKEWVWKEIRANANPKENYFYPYLEQRGFSKDDIGLKQASQAAANRYGRIRQLCPEDIQHLEDQISDWYTQKP